ncbi:hypothetical protein TNCV_2555671 [Trichonephila clavipes]|nr:hypothetical protein TNCV_2555671 [Trichonephila clavipes]
MHAEFESSAAKRFLSESLILFISENNNIEQQQLPSCSACLKDLRKGPISKIDLRKMVMKFEDSGDLGVLPGRGRRPVGTETIEEVASYCCG